MSQVEVVQVDPAMNQLLAEISALANDGALPAHAALADVADLSGRGFLVSGYDAERYREAAAHRQLAATLVDGHPTSFILTYGSGDEVDAGDLGSLFIRERFGPRTPIIKQIATSRAHAGQGHARLLYERFAAAEGADVFAAIVKSPPNLGSEAFHRKLGFYECAVFEHSDGRPRGIWRWPSALQPHARSGG